MTKIFHILLVEDNPGDARLIQEYLKASSFIDTNLKIAGTLKDAFKLIKETQFDLIILDLGLPDSSGLETIAKMMEQDYSIPIVVLTGIADDKRGMAAIEGGAQDYLVKDNINSEMLTRSIRYAIHRSQSQQEVIKSEMKYHSLWENSDKGLELHEVVLDEDGEAIDSIILDVNSTFERIAGKRKEDVVGKRYSQTKDHIRILPPDINPKETLWQVALTGEPMYLEFYNEHRQCWYSVSLYSPSVGKYVCAVQDITNKKIAAKALADSELKFRRLFEESMIGIELFDDKGRLIEVNQAILDIFGISSSDELRGFSLFEDPNLPPDVKNRLRKGESVTYQVEFDFNLVHENNLYKTSKIGTMFIESMISPMILEGGNNPDSYIVHIRDITKQIKANEILEESEKTFRRLFENAPTNYQSLDENGCFIEVNQKWLDTLGYTHEEVIGRPFSEFLHPNCLPKFKETFAAFLLNGQVSGIEYQLRCRDGEFIDVSYEGCSKKDETDGSIRTQCVFIDITEQKRTESLIRKERDLAQLYLDIAGSIIVALDADANITLMNKQACNTLACSADEFIGKNWFESFIPESIRSEVQTVFGRIMEGDNIDFSTNENVVQTSTGEEKIISWSNTVLLDDTGTPIGTLSSGQDITEREAILKALKASEELHRLVLSSMNNLIFVIDKNNRYTELYASVVMMANKPPDYFLNKRIEETLPKEIAQKLIESIENVRESGIQDEVEYSLIQDGKEEWFIATINRHQDGESVVQSVRNISLRLKAQRETKQAADTALLYLDIMSHDVRNQLQAIVMATEILEHLELDVESDLMLQLIIDSVEKSQNLINKILSTRNLLSSSLEEQSLLLPLKNAISKIEKSYPNLEIKTDFPNRNICVHADVFIEQLFSNIIENGVEFNKSKNRKLWINIQELENGYQVSITDNGQGISGDKKESLFDPTRRFGGIGIHQSIRILQKYGGHISVYDRVPSDYSQGTEFRLWFPKAA